MSNLIKIKRRLSTSTLGGGAPLGLAEGEPAVNFIDSTLYIQGDIDILAFPDKEYVDTAISTASSSLGTMAAQNADAVTISGGSVKASLDGNQYAIKNVGQPVDSNDVIRKTDLETALSGFSSAFEYIGTIQGNAELASATDLSLLQKKSTGDYYKVATSGYFILPPNPGFYANTGDGVVFNNFSGIDIIDNTNSNVSGTTDYIDVTGSKDTGFTVNISQDFKNRVSGLESDVTSLESGLSSLQGSVTTIESDITSLESGLSSLQGSVTTIESDITSIEGDITTIESTITSMASGSGVISADINVVSVTQGIYKDGDIIPSGTSLETIIKNMLQQLVAATYNNPTLSVTTTSTLNPEIGTNVTANISLLWAKNDAGLATEFRVKKDNTVVSTTSSSTPVDYSESFQLLENVAFTAEADYSTGAQKYDNFNQPSGTPIAAGTKVSSNTLTFTPRRKTFYGSSTTSSLSATTSSQVRSLTGSALGHVDGSTFSISIPSGAKIVTIAYPSGLGALSSVKYVELGNTEVKDTFTETTVSVSGENNASPTNYRVYTYIPSIPFSSASTYSVTI